MDVLAELGDESVARIAGRCRSVTLARRDGLGPTAEPSAALLAIEEGYVLIGADFRNGDGHVPVGRRVVVATGQRGTLLAPPALGERLEAVTQARVTIVSADSLRLLLGFQKVAEAIVEAFTDSLRERQWSLRNCTYVRHTERVRHTLIQLARTYGHVVPSGIRVDFPLTHQLLADMVGSARETVSIALSELAQEGFLLRQHRRYVVRVRTHDLRLLDARPDAAPALAGKTRHL